MRSAGVAIARTGRPWLLAVLAQLLLAGCGSAIPSSALTPASSSTVSASAAPSPSPSPSRQATAACKATDQDRYVYHPDRLIVRAACARVTGTVLAIRQEADGDLHVRVQLDAPFRNMLTPENQLECGQGVCGLLVVEPICVDAVTQLDAESSCADDTDPLRGLPVLNQHIWLEGRYVLDSDHSDWAELHPLYRWGLA
jgi:hypothetical protein